MNAHQRNRLKVAQRRRRLDRMNRHFAVVERDHARARRQINLVGALALTVSILVVLGLWAVGVL